MKEKNNLTKIQTGNNNRGYFKAIYHNQNKLGIQSKW